MARAGYGVLGLLLLAFLACYLWEALAGGGRVPQIADDLITQTVQFGAVGLCLWAALRPGSSRLVGLVLGTGLLLWSIGDLFFDLQALSGDVPVPSISDAFYLSFYPLAYFAVALVVYRQRSRMPLGTLLDGLLTGAGAAAVCAAVGVDVAFAPGTGSRLAVAVNLAYPIGDLTLIVVVMGALVLLPAGVGRWWLLLAGGALFAASDTAFLVQSAHNTYRQGGLTDLGWPLAILLMSAAPWAGARSGPADGDGGRSAGGSARSAGGPGRWAGRPARWARRLRLRRPAGVHLLLPSLAALAGLAILVYGTEHRLRQVDIVLAVITLVAAGARMPLTLREVSLLAAERQLREQAEHGQRQLARQQAEIQALAARLSGLLHAAPIGIIETDTGGRVVRWNRAATSIYGWTEADVLGLPDPNGQVAAGTGAAPVAQRHRRADGSVVSVEITRTELTDEHGLGAGVLTLVSDVSRRQALEIQLRHAQRLESVGRLAEGLAHEINTPIQFAGDNLRFVRQVVDSLVQIRAARCEAALTLTSGGRPDSVLEQLHGMERDLDVEFLVAESADAIQGAIEGVERVAAIVHAMKVFGRPGDGGFTPVDLNEAIGVVLTVAQSRIAQVADVVTELAPLPQVTCRADDINQVLLDLIANAVDAMAGSGRGRGLLRLRTGVTGDAVEVQVSDTGTGIPPEVAEQVFDPFFTTKPVGEGIGQGLAAARAIVVDRHGGSIDFRTELGAGTTFTVRLPLR